DVDQHVVLPGCSTRRIGAGSERLEGNRVHSDRSGARESRASHSGFPEPFDLFLPLVAPPRTGLRVQPRTWTPSLGRSSRTCSAMAWAWASSSLLLPLS